MDVSLFFQKKLTLHSEKSTWNLKITPSGEENHLQNLHFWFQNPNFLGCNTLFEVPFPYQIIGPPELWKLWKNEAVLNQKWKRYRKWNLKSKMEVLLLFFGNDAFIPCSISKQKVSVSASIARSYK